MIRTDTLTQLFDVTSLLANQPLPLGGRVGILTNAGGPGILAVDALEANGLHIIEFSDELKSKLRSLLSPDASVTNPVDMIASAGPAEYSACIDALLSSDEIDALMTIFIPAAPEGVEEISTAIRDAMFTHHGEKTSLIVFMSSGGAPPVFHSDDKKIPTFAFPEQAAFALAKAVEHEQWRQKDEGAFVELDGIDAGAARTVVEAALERDGSGWLDPDDGRVCARRLRVGDAQVGGGGNRRRRGRRGGRMGGAVVLKVVSDSALHKSDVGGVVLNIEGEAQVRLAYDEVTAAVDDAEGVLVQQYVEGGHEVLIGMTEDPNFGPLIVFGLGGVFVELIGDVAFRIHPLTDLDAAEMIKEVKSAKLLEGYRGGAPGDISAVREALLRVSALVADLPEIVEMDMNPVKVAKPGQGLKVVDARIRVRPVQGAYLPSRRDVLAEL